MLLPAELLLENDARLEGEELAGGDGEWFAALGVATLSVVLLVDNKIYRRGRLKTRPRGKKKGARRFWLTPWFYWRRRADLNR